MVKSTQNPEFPIPYNVWKWNNFSRQNSLVNSFWIKTNIAIWRKIPTFDNFFREKSLVTLSNQSRHCNLKEKLSYETFWVIFKHCTFIPHQRKETDEVSSSGYSSSFNAEYYPVQTDTMDTEDYELYDPRIHAARPGPTRIVQPRVANKVKPREVLTYSLLTLHKSLHENH